MSAFQDTFEDWLMADTDLTYDEWLSYRLRGQRVPPPDSSGSLTTPEHSGALPPNHKVP